MSAQPKEPKWLRLDAVLAGHKSVMKEHGGQGGLLKPGELESALARPKNIWAYKPESSLFELAAAYSKGINQNHGFNDGNKRASLMAAYTFLRINGYKLKATEVEAVHFTEGLASGKVTEKQYGSWLEARSVKIKRARSPKLKAAVPKKRGPKVSR